MTCQTKTLAARLVLGCLLVVALPARAAPTINAFVTATTEDDYPVESAGNTFACRDKIFAVIDLAGLTPGQHRLHVDWIDPGGKYRERIAHEFTSSDSARLTVWLQLHPPTGAALVSAFNPAVGMGEFIGEWQVEIRIDDSAQVRKHFEVLC